MSSSIAIAIPQRKHQSQDPVSHHHQHHRHSASSSSSAGDSSCSAASSYNAATSFFPSSTPPSGLSMLSEKQKSKLPVGVEIPTPTTASPPSNARSGSTSPISPRRPSLLGSSLSKSEYTVVNLGHEDGPPRLVTCVKSSQGFDWNLGE